MATQKFFDVSTIHVPSSNAFDDIDCVIAEYNEGWFLYIPFDPHEIKLLPNWLQAIFEKALYDNCWFVRIDADGEQYDNLKTFDW